MGDVAADSLAPFDSLAAGYDAGFTESVLGRLLRAAVWRRLDACFAAGARILDLGCGTGEDAIHLARRGLSVVGIDAAPAMIAVARSKALQADVTARATFHTSSVESWAMDPTDRIAGSFDGAMANFGVLNCIEDLAPVTASLARVLRPGGRLVLVVMGPLVPWEWLWHLLRGSPRTALRRLRPGGVAWRGLLLRYPSPGPLSRSFSPTFRRLRLSALGVLLPPSEAAGLVERHPKFFSAMARIERRCGHWRPLPHLADHYILELQRQPEA